MKKFLFVLVSVMLLASLVEAADWSTALTADLSARNIGRSRATDSSVIMKVWSGGALSNPGVGVSGSSVLKIYLDTIDGSCITLATNNTSYDTVGELVDYINSNFSSDSSVKLYASIGPDAYRDMSAACLAATDLASMGQTKDSAATVVTGNSRLMGAGIEAQDGVTPRIKSISAQIPASGASGITLKVYDGNTKVWQRYTGLNAYVSATANAASPNSVIFPEGKGISGTKGNGLVAVVTTDANVDRDSTAALVNNIAIVYDLYRD